MSELIPLESVNAMELFQGEALDALLDRIKEEATDFEPDMDSDAGRKEIISQAFKVRRSKVVIDNAGKELVADLKARCKEVDDGRRKAREYLDKLAEEIRRPVTEWEEAEKEREARELEEKRRKLEEEKAADEARRAEEAEKLSAREAELEEERKALAAQKEELRQKELSLERRQRMAAESESAEKAEEAAAALEAERKEKEAAQQKAEEAEKREAERKAKEEAEAKEREKREADAEHKRKCNGDALRALMAEGLERETARKAVIAIVKGRIPHISIAY